jgi:predicted nucleic acid-binding Zn ribbon protein
VTRDPAPLAEVLDRLVRSLRGSPASAQVGVMGRWEEAVGGAVAAHARPVSLDRGELVVEVDDPAWATQLRFLEHTVLGRLSELVGPSAVTAVVVRVRRS